MRMKSIPAIFAAAIFAFSSLGAFAGMPSRSVYESAPDDPRAIKVQAKGDGVTDDTAAIQTALDQAKTGGGIGATRPVFVPRLIRRHCASLP